MRLGIVNKQLSCHQASSSLRYERLSDMKGDIIIPISWSQDKQFESASLYGKCTKVSFNGQSHLYRLFDPSLVRYVFDKLRYAFLSHVLYKRLSLSPSRA